MEQPFFCQYNSNTVLHSALVIFRQHCAVAKFQIFLKNSEEKPAKNETAVIQLFVDLAQRTPKQHVKKFIFLQGASNVTLIFVNFSQSSEFLIF